MPACPACCIATCTVEPFCCDVTWDATCVEIANLLCDPEGFGCGSENAGSCLEPHGSPYCEDPVCCALVCEQLPECCESAWDKSCVALAEELCPIRCNEKCPPDLNFDGEVGGPDLAIVLGHWSQRGCADLDGSGTVDGGDIAIVLNAWGPCGDT